MVSAIIAALLRGLSAAGLGTAPIAVPMTSEYQNRKGPSRKDLRVLPD
jgi:hypothetical protein